MRDKSKNLPFPPELAENITKAIYCHYSLMGERQDLRHYGGWKDILKIMFDIKVHGYNAAVRRNSIGCIYCKACSDTRKGRFVEMHLPESDSQDQEWRCPQCQGTAQLQTYFSTKHLRNIHDKTLKK
jgi:hypothetical protein